MTTWREQYRAASFRGVPFLVEEDDTERGRRTDLVKYANREDVYVEDLGGDADTFTITMYVIGDDYIDQLDALETALLRKGPGILVHPYRGEKNVVVHGKWKVKQTRKEGGKASMAITFVDQPPNTTSTSRPDTAALVSVAAGAARAAVQADFLERIALDLPDSYLASFTFATQRVVSTIARVNGVIAQVVGVESLLGPFVSRLGVEAEAVISAPTAFADTAMNLLVTVPSVGLDIRATAIGQARNIRNLADLERRRRRTNVTLQSVQEIHAFGAALPTIGIRTSNTAIERSNRAALVQMVRAGNAIGFALACLAIPWDSFGQAMDARTLLVEIIDAITIDADVDISDDAYETLSVLRARTVDHLAAVASRLPRIRTYQPPTDLPALVVAHLLYGDVTRESEILARNDPPNPALLSSKDAIEVAFD